jgi:hypothetical protein
VIDDPRTEGKAFADFLVRLTPEQRAEGNKYEIERAKADYEDFKKAFGEGKCSICWFELTSSKFRCELGT